MQNDTRSRNKYFDHADPYKYFTEYISEMKNAAVLGIRPKDLQDAVDIIRLTLACAGRIFVGGNGGSASISDHLCCDWQKGTVSDKTNSLIVHNLGGSPALFSAIANDIGYEETLSFDLELQRVINLDTVILISSSGNSPNIIKAAEMAHKYNATVIGLTGFDGGKLKQICDVSLHIPINNYGVVEDCHQAIMHILAQFHFLSLNDGR